MDILVGAPARPLVEEKDSKSNPLPAGLAVKRTSCRQ
jgi:hypothetical protein